jgi:hypothetical protein
MTPNDAAVGRDFAALRKGRGIGASHLRQRVGDDLAALCSCTADDDATTRQRIERTVRELLDAARNCIALPGGPGRARARSGRTTGYGRRQTRMVSATVPCDIMTVRRLEGPRLRAHDSRGDGPRRDRPSATGRTRVRMVQRRGRVAADPGRADDGHRGTRTIVANTDGFREIEAALSVPRPPQSLDEPGVSASVHFGAGIVAVPAAPQRYRSRCGSLGNWLGASGTRTRSHSTSRPARPMRQHYVFQPLRRISRFDLRTTVSGGASGYGRRKMVSDTKCRRQGARWIWH